jgi:hypothetical protein
MAGGVLVLDCGPVRLYGQTSAVAALAAILVFAWEMSLAGWMIAKRLKPSPTLDHMSG